MKAIQKSLQEIMHYPSAVAGCAIVAGLVILSVYTMIAIPYDQAVTLWRGGEEVWGENPKTALPIWVNLFLRKDLPESMVLDSSDSAPPKTGTVSKSRQSITEEMIDVVLSFTFDYTYDVFPQELILYFDARYQRKQAQVTMTWITPDGRKINLGDLSVQQHDVYRIGQDARLQRKFGELPIEKALFADPNFETPVPLKGTYQLEVGGIVFETTADLDAKFVLHGQVHGVAGTDHRRRDLSVALLWGTPIALAFGLLAALGTTLATMIIAAIGVWFGGWIDSVIQRITEVNLIIPFLPILIMIGTLYSRSIWLMLGASILLNTFGAGIKSYRAIFMQVKESPYIEAARAYGASNLRLIFSYLIPRIIPVSIPRLVNVIPTFVFLEATLAVLGLGDPVMPTWGKVIDDARTNGALHQGLFYWVLEPSALLMLTGLAFALIGFALDRIFNPRLRGV